MRWIVSPYLRLLPRVPHGLHQPREDVRQRGQAQRLLQRPEDLEGAAGVVARGAGQRRLQGRFAQQRLKLETCGGGLKRT